MFLSCYEGEVPRVTMRPEDSDLYCRVLQGEVLVNVTVSDESLVSSVELEYSLDDGATWTKTTEEVILNDTHEFSLGALSGYTYVSLRVNATDFVGNSISQTTIRGFYVVPHVDISVTNVTLSKTVIGQGYLLCINVTVENQGDYTETFNLTTYWNTTEIETKEVTLTNGTSTNIIFSWDTTDLPRYEEYNIKAYAHPVPGETDLVHNTFIDGTVFIVHTGDVNADGTVDISDLYIIASAFGEWPGRPNWDPNADLNGDEIMDISDLYVIALNYGWPPP